MDEEVVSASVGLDEPESARPVEPFDSAIRHEDHLRSLAESPGGAGPSRGPALLGWRC